MERASDYEFVLINADLEEASRDLQAMFRTIILRSARQELIGAALRPQR
jgi:guanylate kinase